MRGQLLGVKGTRGVTPSPSSQPLYQDVNERRRVSCNDDDGDVSRAALPGDTHA